MRYCIVLAGGSGTRLWPMSRASLPKQLIPFIGGRSLLEIAFDRLEGLVPPDRRLVCASQSHEAMIRRALPWLGQEQYLGEPCGRDTLNAVGFGAALLARRDPDAILGVFTADHVIEPLDAFQKIVGDGFSLVEQRPETLVAFGITPTEPAVGYGYLELGEPLEAESALKTCSCSCTRNLGQSTTAWRVREFREKPDRATAVRYFEAGPKKYLWNSGMFVWRAATLLDCIRRFAPENYAGLMRIAEAWDTPRRREVLEAVYPTLPKTSVDYAVMEPASRAAAEEHEGQAHCSAANGRNRNPSPWVAAIPMSLRWLDVGSWPSFAQTCRRDENQNALAAERTLLIDTRGTLAASSDPAHLIAAIGCEDLIVVHTPDATLVCRADRAEAIKELHRQLAERFGKDFL